MDVLLQIQWDYGPNIVELGPLTFRWYGLLFALGFLIGFFIMRWIYRREGKPEQDLDPLLLYLLAGTIIGARLGHIFFYHPVYYLTHPVEIVKVWEGGLASHGGVIGILIALYLFSRSRPDQPYLWLLDRLSIPVALTGSFIRIGNVFNSEILGTEAQVPWAFVFTRIDQVPRHPVQLYESGTYLLIFIGLLVYYRRYGPDVRRGMLTGIFFLTVFGARFLLEYFKVRQAAFGESLPLSMGQILSIPMALIGVYLIKRAAER